LFAASALVSVGGSIAAYYGQKLLFQVAAACAVVTGGSAVVGLASGCTVMVHETRLAVRNLAEGARIRAQLRRGDEGPRLHNSAGPVPTEPRASMQEPSR